MEGLIIGLILIISVILVLLVLAQDSKGGGLTAGMGGASRVMGARRTTDWIEKATWIFAIALFSIILSTNAIFQKQGTADSYQSTNVENAIPVTTDTSIDDGIGDTQGTDNTNDNNDIDSDN